MVAGKTRERIAATLFDMKAQYTRVGGHYLAEERGAFLLPESELDPVPPSGPETRDLRPAPLFPLVAFAQIDWQSLAQVFPQCLNGRLKAA